MTTDFRALCAELVDIITAHANPDDCTVGHVAGVLIRARFALADGPVVPQSPAEGEVAKLVQHLHHAAEVDGWNGASPEWCQSMLRAAELLQRQEPVPVPVSERPWEGEGWCDKQGRCWFGREESDDWSADWTLATPEAVEEFCTYASQTVCLPAHALPLPEAE